MIWLGAYIACVLLNLLLVGFASVQVKDNDAVFAAIMLSVFLAPVMLCIFIAGTVFSLGERLGRS